ncbi:long-chain fatty acid--CoA ligase [Bacillus sp. HMF5848]|uniref:long-chain-fatty-acid--CoA ligase n=1 Tax=Bacillus sp. HMF5848 TaxID=2495421 RepID=UPI000F7B0D98|nr:long-chain fatty acid--CoA ligase [Bacillus sp. HMF5848]RSK26621.1 long-chain fatty acid--CoA ligase [Bacillus sp. HMF5848]
MGYEQKPWLKLYDRRIPHNVSIEETNLFELLAKAARKYGENPALSFFGKSWSFFETKHIAETLASSLHNSGFKKGDRFAIMLPNSPHYIFSLFAAFRIGGIVVQVNPMYVQREIEYVLKDSGAEYMIVLDAFYEKVKQVQPNTSLKKIIVVSFTGTKHELADGDVYFDELLFMKQQSPLPEVEIDREEDIAVLQYTGGTTGVSKGVMLTHNNLLSNVIQVCDFSYLAWDDKPENFNMMSVLPMFHVFGLSCNALAGIREGCNQLILPRFDVREVMEIVKREKPLQMSAVPTMYIALNSQPDLEDYGFDHIHFVSSGGAALPVEQIKIFERKTGNRLVDGYGLSESSPSAIFNPPFLERKLGSIGIPIPGTECRIVKDTLEGVVDVPVGEAGELIIRGPQVMKGYWNRPEETKLVLEDGWLFTGDIARMDEDGYFYILDRKKDVIIASGYNVYPREIEEVLYQHEAIEEALVIGISNEYRGESVKAFVKLRIGFESTAEDIIQFAKQYLAPFKVPEVVEVKDELPKSSVGKLLRRALRDLEQEKLNV